MKTISRALLIILFTFTAAFAQTKTTDNGWPRKFAIGTNFWFVATSPVGPWSVALSVPVVIYTIPVSSPLHYVTYVKIYGSSPEVVYVGYTPGYYGTVVTSTNVVVYGTGWYYPPYVGAYWYGAPYTYGYGVYYGVYGWSGVAATNVYGQWGNVAYSGTRAAWANAYTGNVGYGGVYTGVNSATGTRYAARGGTNTNVYTGTTVTGGAAAAYNPNTGRISAGQAGTASNVYTGNSAAGARGATYNPQTGVISGGAAGGVRNGSTGQVTAGAGGFAYNTRTDTGVAVGNNNVYASKDGNIYRYNQSTGVQQRTSNGWSQCHDPRIEVGFRISTRLAALVKCAHATSVRCAETSGEDKPQITRICGLFHCDPLHARGE